MNNNKKNKNTTRTTDKNIVSRKYQRKNEDIPTDVLGSYTGTPENPYEKPVQDADDL